MSPAVVDWGNAPCPDCHRAALAEGVFASRLVPSGFVVTCRSCGFSLAGRDRERLLAFVRLLVKGRLM